jgi:hypothetical protein
VSEQTGLLIQSLIGKMADDILAKHQTHLVVRAEDGMVTMRDGFVEWRWKNMAAVVFDAPWPYYGRVWIHVE